MIDSLYDHIDIKHQQLFNQNNQHLVNMLDFAINELVSLSEDNEIYLVDNGKVCTDYESIFECLKHWAIKRENTK